MDKQGIKWSVDQAMIEDCGTFQTEEGEPMAWAKMAYFGGMASLKITPDELPKVSPFKGKMISASGRLVYEIKKGSGKESIHFKIDEIKPLCIGIVHGFEAQRNKSASDVRYVFKREPAAFIGEGFDYEKWKGCASLSSC